MGDLVLLSPSVRKPAHGAGGKKLATGGGRTLGGTLDQVPA